MKIDNIAVMHETKFGSIKPKISLEDMKDKGIDFGDSLNLYFSNGEKLLDVPYYNGYYVRTGKPVVCGYPGYLYPSVTDNNGGDLWIRFNLCEKDTVSIEMNTKGKYISVQKAMNVIYTNKREDYESDEIYANFRPMNGGNMKNDFFYRSASPCDNQFNRAHCTDKLLNKYGINFILNLADNEDEIRMYREYETYDSENFDILYDKNHVALLDLSADYSSLHFKKVLCDGIRKMMKYDGPYLVHCTEGKDRTGFVCILLEALMGFTYQEMKEDYMETYKNYYGFTAESDPDKYKAFVENKFNDMAMYVGDIDDESKMDIADYCAGARKYLKEGGLSDDEVDFFIDKLIKK
ncbi:MAG: tyrosine-protein phosphatase [Erysipelotrichaceae bacterium]|nr:tyrosine-protein phosphatase [Erysipelotrichaceae bacterium]